MHTITLVSLAYIAFSGNRLFAYAQQSVWGQCGGNGWSGPTTCVSGSSCKYSNDYYSQCVPGEATSTTRPAPTASQGSISSKTTTASGSSSTEKGSFILTGDSTVTDNAGWGGAFCSQVLASGVACTNFAHSGTTTASFRAGGDWARALAAAKAAKKPCYLTIQFGHNDMKVMDLATYKANLQQLGKDVQAISGVTPIFVTSLSRRTFSGTTVKDSLPPWAATMITAANAIKANYVDLNTASLSYLNKIGSTAAHKMDFAKGDSTHLNACGAKVFGRMVADLIYAKHICVPNPFISDASTTSAISNGVSLC